MYAFTLTNMETGVTRTVLPTKEDQVLHRNEIVTIDGATYKVTNVEERDETDSPK